MSLHPLKLTDDEVQRLLTRAYSETGYRLDRRDPIIVQYVIQKALLQDFSESQALIFGEFSQRVMPAITTEAKKLEEQKKKLWDLSKNASTDLVHKAGEDYLRLIRDVLRKTDTAMLENLDRHIVRLRNEQNEILTNLQAKHKAFIETARDFKKALLYFALAGVVMIGTTLAVVVHYFAK